MGAISLLLITIASAWADPPPNGGACKPYPLGQKFYIKAPHEGEMVHHQFSNDLRYLYFEKPKSGYYVYDIQTDSSYEIDTSTRKSGGSAHAHEGSFYYGNFKRDLKTGQETEIKAKGMFSRNYLDGYDARTEREGKVYSLTSDKTVEVTEKRSGKLLESIKLPKDYEPDPSNDFVGDGLRYYARDKQGNRYLAWKSLDPSKPNTTIRMKLEGDRDILDYEARCNQFIRRGNGRVEVFSASGKPIQTIPYSWAFSGNGTNILTGYRILDDCKAMILSLQKEGSNYEVIYAKASLKNGQIKKLISNEGGKTLEASSDWKSIVSSEYGKNEFKVIKADTEETLSVGLGLVRASNVQISSDGNTVIYEDLICHTFESKYRCLVSVPLEKVCVKDTLFVECISTNESKCIDRNGAPLDGSKILAAISARQLCEEPFDEKKWDQITGPDPSSSLSEDVARAYLMRFNKPGGFDPARHLPILLAIFRSPLILKEPTLTAGALHTILNQSNALYEELVWQWPKLSALKIGVGAPFCRSPQDEALLVEGAKRHLRYLLNQSTPLNYPSWVTQLGAITPLLAKISTSEKEKTIDDIAQKLADWAADSKEFHDIFLSKLYKFTSHAIRPLFGEQVKPLTDITLLRVAGGVKPVILGSAPINGDEKTKTYFGFSAQSQNPVVFSRDLLKLKKRKMILTNFSWTQNGQTFTSDLKLEAAEAKGTLVPEGSGPDYASLWKDKALTGMIVVGSNYREHGEWLMDEYLDYYHKQGFAIDPQIIKVPHLKGFLSEKIKSGELDYLVKEAHSDGDEKNLFRMDHLAQLMVGTKKLPDGRIEKIYLIYPFGGDTELLSNNEFGEWLRERSATKKGQFVYFNTSCWSASKAVHEIEAARDPILLNIPTLTTTLPFENKVGNAENLLFTAFREKKSFEEMREQLRKNEGYKSENENVFIFPDERKYTDRITNLFDMPLKIDLKIRDPQGKLYSIEQ